MAYFVCAYIHASRQESNPVQTQTHFFFFPQVPRVESKPRIIYFQFCFLSLTEFGTNSFQVTAESWTQAVSLPLTLNKKQTKKKNEEFRKGNTFLPTCAQLLLLWLELNVAGTDVGIAVQQGVVTFKKRWHGGIFQPILVQKYARSNGWQVEPLLRLGVNPVTKCYFPAFEWHFISSGLISWLFSIWRPTSAFNVLNILHDTELS